MRASEISAGEKADRLQLARIRRIQNRDSVAEHVADIKMPPVEHHLNAIRPSTEIAEGQMMEALSDSLRWNCGLLRGTRFAGARRQRRETQQAFQAIASSDRLQICSRYWPIIKIVNEP